MFLIKEICDVSVNVRNKDVAGGSEKGENLYTESGNTFLLIKLIWDYKLQKIHNFRHRKDPQPFVLAEAELKYPLY